mgnify:CR=1 FL=1
MDLLVNSIQKTFEILEEIEKDLVEQEKRSYTAGHDTEDLFESLLKDSEPSSIRKGRQNSRKSFSNGPNDLVKFFWRLFLFILLKELNNESFAVGMGLDEELEPSPVSFFGKGFLFRDE